MLASDDFDSDGRSDLAVAAPGSFIGVLLNRPVPGVHCAGDADDDCSVTFIDITTVLANFGNVYGAPPVTGPGDADLSGAVTILDITAVLANIGSACGS